MKFLTVYAALPLALLLLAEACAAEPEWIWATQAAPLHSPVKTAAFRLAFKLNAVSRAVVEVTCDNRYQVYVNGQHLGGGDDWQTLNRYDIAKLVKPGANVIAIEATNDEGPAGLVVRSDIQDTGGVLTDISTSKHWKFSVKPAEGWRDVSFDDAQWKPAFAVGAYGKTPPWTAASAAALDTAASDSSSPPQLPAPAHPLELRDGERVVFVGGTFIERLQTFGYLESQLTTAQPDRHVVFRNLGWSGDTVWGEARAVFGSANDGFQRLLKDLRQTRPTLVYVAYGANEANAGDAGLENFKAGLKRLLDELGKIQPRIVLVSPLRRENLGPPLPDQRRFNASVKLYADAIAAEAKTRNLPYVDLLDLVGDESGELVSGAAQLTDNGIHLSPYGQWKLAPVIAARLTGGSPPPKNVIEIDGAKALAAGKVSITAKRLPLAAAPAHSPPEAASAPAVSLRVSGLPAGNYEIRIDGRESLRASAVELATGAPLAADPNLAQEAQLRSAIAAKNELFFHRHRPQNETYLFLFRKGEQGNNAVEIPQFDPLIEAKEKEIATLRTPQPHEFEIIREK